MWRITVTSKIALFQVSLLPAHVLTPRSLGYLTSFACLPLLSFSHAHPYKDACLCLAPSAPLCLCTYYPATGCTEWDGGQVRTQGNSLKAVEKSRERNVAIVQWVIEHLPNMCDVLKPSGLHILGWEKTKPWAKHLISELEGKKGRHFEDELSYPIFYIIYVCVYLPIYLYVYIVDH